MRLLLHRRRRRWRVHLRYLPTDVRYVPVGVAIEPAVPEVVGEVLEEGAFTIVAGELPAGLELDVGTGVISGTPTEALGVPQTVLVMATGPLGSSGPAFVGFVVTPL